MRLSTEKDRLKTCPTLSFCLLIRATKALTNDKTQIANVFFKLSPRQTVYRGKMHMKWKILLLTVVFFAGISFGSLVSGQQPQLKKWQKGKGWGWVWGKDDEVGSLNEMTDTSRLSALRIVERGKVYDLGVLYDRTSYKWPGHSPGEIISFRTPEGVKRQQDQRQLVNNNESRTAWHSSALFINDNVATRSTGSGTPLKVMTTIGTTGSRRLIGEGIGGRGKPTLRRSLR
jgi:hypothetical protein